MWSAARKFVFVVASLTTTLWDLEAVGHRVVKINGMQQYQGMHVEGSVVSLQRSCCLPSSLTHCHLLLLLLQPALQQPTCSAQSALEARPCAPSWLSA
jgi:hypothetical protein